LAILLKLWNSVFFSVDSSRIREVLEESTEKKWGLIASIE
jgi:hypothetical protein